jgi:hypothetical protein
MKYIPLIRHETWNSMVDTIKRRRPLTFNPSPESGKWEHPWTIKPTWGEIDQRKGTKGQWLFKIKPGFVNGLEVTIPTRVKHASERTLARLKDEKEDLSKPNRIIDAYLTEWPMVEIGPTRVIGTGASPTGFGGSALSSSGLRLSYEPVPKFFADLGVNSANTQITGGVTGGISFIDGQEDTKAARRLRACDVSLWKDRPSAKFEVYPGSLLDGTLGAIYVTYNHSGGMKKNAYLRVSPKFNPPPVPESEMALLEGMTDPEYDLTQIATIYFVSPEGVDPSAELDATWTPYVKYNHFWNLSHSTQNIPDATPIEPIRLTTGLAGGLADITIATLLAPLNSQLNELIQTLKSRNMKGVFWSS